MTSIPDNKAINEAIEKAIEEFCFHRRDTAEVIVRESNIEYQKYSEEGGRLYREIESQLPQNLQSRLLDLDTAYSNENSTMCSALYRAGVEDGIKVAFRLIKTYL